MSFAVASLEEAKNFNITVWQMLRPIQMFVSLVRSQRIDASSKIRFLFKKEKGQKYFTGSVMFSQGSIARPIRTQPLLDGVPLTFTPPEGESVDTSFGWLCSEVHKLAYAMTNGEIMQDFYPLPHFETYVDDFAISTTVEMVLAYGGPDRALVHAPLAEA